MPYSPPERLNIFDYFLGARIEEGLGKRTAVRTDERRWTYAEVHALSGKWANVLLEAGVRPEERVILSLPDGIDYVAALFGILRLGAVVVMVNPDLGEEQIRYFYEYTRARVGIINGAGDGAFWDALEGAEHTPILLEATSDRIRAELDRVPETHAPFRSHRDDPAMWIFSGGTTGHPKAAVQAHRSFANTTEAYAKGVLEIGPDDVTLSVPKLFFGYATGINLFFPFSVGATVCLFPDRCTADTLFEKVRAFRPTILVNVPTMVNHLVGHESAPEHGFSCLRLATSAGEALPAELHRKWDALFGVPLLDGLGTAEMWHIFISNRPDDVRPGTLGKVVPGFEVRACDDEGRQVAAGEVGSLWVRGGSRAIGYWQQHETTAAAFRGEWYVSGDMISTDADGYVTYCGRADDMLKVSGKWLSPKELENCLLQHDAVAEVAVVGVAGADGLVKPHAFVRAEPGAIARGSDEASGGVSADAMALDLQAWAKARLEPYKYPRAVVFLDDLPRTHLGKVDRRALSRGDLQD